MEFVVGPVSAFMEDDKDDDEDLLVLHVLVVLHDIYTFLSGFEAD